MKICQKCKTFHGISPLKFMSQEEDCGFDPSAACVQCGQPVTALSMSGDHICPACDAGYTKSSHLPKIDSATVVEGTKSLAEDGSSGCVECTCGRTFVYSLSFQMNMVEWAGYIVPRCPKCHGVPQSNTRRMDL